MNYDIKLYEKLKINSLGICHLLKTKIGGCLNNVYLFYSENNRQHFIVCEGVSSLYGDYYFNYCRYFNDIESALKSFKNIK